jgi:hypothetical protein
MKPPGPGGGTEAGKTPSCGGGGKAPPGPG